MHVTQAYALRHLLAKNFLQLVEILQSFEKNNFAHFLRQGVQFRTVCVCRKRIRGACSRSVHVHCKQCQTVLSLKVA